MDIHTMIKGWKERESQGQVAVIWAETLWQKKASTAEDQ